MATNITNQQIDNAIPNKGSSTPHAEQPNRKLTNGILKAVVAETNTLGTAATMTNASGGDTLGTAATKDVGTDSGNVMEVQTGGWFDKGKQTSTYTPPTQASDNISEVVYTINPYSVDGYELRAFHPILKLAASNNVYTHILTSNTATPMEGNAKIVMVNGHADNNLSSAVEIYHTGNTTVDPNGFIKAASPIVSLYRDRAESNGSAGLEEMQFEHIATGHYRLIGVPELSRDGWYIETPKDRNGNVYFTLDYVESEGQLDIRTYTPDYSTGRAENGAPTDIIDGRFVSLRFAASPETELPNDAAE